MKLLFCSEMVTEESCPSSLSNIHKQGLSSPSISLLAQLSLTFSLYSSSFPPQLVSLIPNAMPVSLFSQLHLFFVFLVLQCDTNDIFLSWEVFVPSTCISGSLLHHSPGGQKGSTREQETQDDSSVFQCLAISLVTLKLPNMPTPYITNTVSSA